jgi:signal transduction histidine kinase
MNIPINILIVDDEPRNLTALETILDDPVYRLVRAESADEALLALVAEEFALLILDVRMPGMNGFELAQMIKDRKKTARVPIVFLTAYYNEDQHVLEGYGTGAVDYLHKPVNPAILRSKVAVFAELYHKNREVGLANQALLAEVSERQRAVEQLRELNETLEQRVAERTEALMDADRRKDEFLATLAHELRNPLAPIRNGLQVMRLTRGNTEAIEQSHAMMERQLQQMVRLVDDLMDISRISRGKLELKTEQVQLAAVVSSAVETSRPIIDQLGHELTVTLPEQPILIDADMTRLAQVLSNLLNNAAKYSEQGGHIWLTVEHQGRDVVVSVRDAGIGIATDQLPRIFDMFSQVDRSLERSQCGLGIGLTLVRQLVDLHGGTVEARSKGLGEGSEFVVRLPVVVGVTVPQAEGGGEDRAAPKLALRILIVDDNRDSAASLSIMLKLMGHDTGTAYDGEEAVAAVGEFRPDVILLDIGLPKLNGYDACRRIREQPGGEKLFIIAQTGWGQEDDRQRSQDVGFDHHLVKPIDTGVLMKLLSECRTPEVRSARREAGEHKAATLDGMKL